jgi:hypothetical protein
MTETMYGLLSWVKTIFPFWKLQNSAPSVELSNCVYYSLKPSICDIKVKQKIWSIYEMKWDKI